MIKLVFGCGYLGMRAARRWRELGHTVIAVTRSDDRAREFERADLTPLVADITRPETLVNLPLADTVLFAVGYDRGAGKSIGEVYISGLRAVLDALPEGIGKFIYISSTGVFGPGTGAMVDEESPCEPASEGGRACLAAEQLLAEHRLGSRAVVLRMAGIYGPGRIPRRDELLAGRSIAAAPDSRLNLIHVEDAADVIVAADNLARPPRLFLVADGHPVERRQYYRELARLLGVPEPQFAPADAAAAPQARGTSDKRVDNRRMLDELHVRLRYPSFREGLLAATAEPTH